MSAVKEVKLAGFKDLQTTAEMIGRSAQYLSRIFKSNREQFDIILLGCVAKNSSENNRAAQSTEYNQKYSELIRLIDESRAAGEKLAKTEAEMYKQFKEEHKS